MAEGAGLYSARAESDMIGACLLSPAARDVLVRDLVPEDFYQVDHHRWAEAVADLHVLGAPVDATVVAGWVADRYGVDGKEHYLALVSVMAECPSSGSAPAYAARIRDRSVRRRLLAVLADGRRQVEDMSTPAADVAEAIRAGVSSLDVASGEDAPPRTLAEFLAESESYRWLIPRTLERTDRLIITSGEGSGKSTLLRQLAVQVAAGVHPWSTRLRYPPGRALLIDLECSESQARREIRPMYDRVAGIRHLRLGESSDVGFDPSRVMIASRPGGIDLMARADRRWFSAQVAAACPDIILTGPIYKMISGDPTDERQAKALADYLDEIRVRFDTAIVLEAHSPHGTDSRGTRTLRPYGASLWLRWPEFGFGLRMAKDGSGWDWVRWRGPRDRHRWWPEQVRYGQRWPWEPAVYFDDEEAF